MNVKIASFVFGIVLAAYIVLIAFLMFAICYFGLQ